MARLRRYPQTFSAARHSGIIDRLNINAIMIEQIVADPFALGSIAHAHRHNMRRIRHVRNAHALKAKTNCGNTGKQGLALHLAHLQMFDCRNSASSNCRRQGR